MPKPLILNSRYIFIFLLFAACSGTKETVYSEKHRPQIHFSPRANWMNDPNGMVYHEGTWHLFFQYYPDSTVWGPMHWGHATSTDLVHWKEEDIALYPDSLGYIFSGSAVIDQNNTSGLGFGDPPLVALFTYHDPEGEKKGREDYQVQGLAYSLDNGKTWKKYERNPVLPNPGIKDFRDPKLRWYEAGKKWIMSLAAKDRIHFYSSPDLKSWVKESEFGAGRGAHGGVWECPDLFPVIHERDTVWVLLVSINPGGPNGGSATQYFTGDFDGRVFTSSQTETKWLDYGPDNYAGVTWSNTGGRNLFLGWMSNWLYGNQVPTHPWRSAMTIPRDLDLVKINNNYFLRSSPAPELERLSQDSILLAGMDNNPDVGQKPAKMKGPARLKLRAEKLQSFNMILSNGSGEKLVIGYDQDANQYYIDRTASGQVDFQKEFTGRFTAPRLSDNRHEELELVIDQSSVELFADGGITVMTALFFPTIPYSEIRFEGGKSFGEGRLVLTSLQGIWR